MRQMLVSLLKNHSLIIFLIYLFFTGCREQQPASQEQVVVFWEEGKATGLIIPQKILQGIDEDSIKETVSIRLADQSSQQPIAGSFSLKEEEVWFEPLIPFTRGLRYSVYVSDRLLHEFQISEAEETPRLVSIYPTQDTLPENLLKMYLTFSKPMAATRSLQHIILKNERGDTLNDVFLDLPNELWNDDRSVLTLWLNPGRVKRDLQPNRELGAPLRSGNRYSLVVSGDWKDAEGKSLNVHSEKSFVVADRDNETPLPDNWKLQIPKVKTREELHIRFNEPLDYFLLKNSIEVIDSAGNAVAGISSIGEEEKVLRFKPVDAWVSGMYRLKIEARLEDLAGNNLNRPFDRDLKSKTPLMDTDIFERKFTIQ